MTANSKPVTSVEDMKTRVDACLASLKSLQSRLENGVSAGPAAAQAARLVGFAIAKQAGEIFKSVNQTTQYLSAPAPTPKPEGDAKAPLDQVMEIAQKMGETSIEEITTALVEVVQEVVESMAAQLEVEPEAIGAFLFETNAYMLVVVEDMLTKATAKLDEADALTAAA